MAESPQLPAQPPMPRYVPYAGKHSIAEAVVGLQLLLPIEPKTAQILSEIQENLRSELPRFDPMQVLTVGFNLGTTVPSTPVAAPTMGGFTLIKVNSDGRPNRMLRVMHNAITAHFLSYTSWAEIRPDALKYLGPCIRRLGEAPEIRIVAFLLRYIDRFTFEGNADDGRAEMLLRKESKFIAPTIFEQGPFWHCNTGWYAPDRQGRALHQLNVGSNTINKVGTITIDHTAQDNFERAKTVQEAFGAKFDDLTQLETSLERQHTTNKQIVADLLLTPVAKEIGVI